MPSVHRLHAHNSNGAKRGGIQLWRCGLPKNLSRKPDKCLSPATAPASSQPGIRYTPAGWALPPAAHRTGSTRRPLLARATCTHTIPMDWQRHKISLHKSSRTVRLRRSARAAARRSPPPPTPPHASAGPPQSAHPPSGTQAKIELIGCSLRSYQAFWNHTAFLERRFAAISQPLAELPSSGPQRDRAAVSCPPGGPPGRPSGPPLRTIPMHVPPSSAFRQFGVSLEIQIRDSKIRVVIRVCRLPGCRACAMRHVSPACVSPPSPSGGRDLQLLV